MCQRTGWPPFWLSSLIPTFLASQSYKRTPLSLLHMSCTYLGHERPYWPLTHCNLYGLSPLAPGIVSLNKVSERNGGGGSAHECLSEAHIHYGRFWPDERGGGRVLLLEGLFFNLVVSCVGGMSCLVLIPCWYMLHVKPYHTVSQLNELPKPHQALPYVSNPIRLSLTRMALATF